MRLEKICGLLCAAWCVLGQGSVQAAAPVAAEHGMVVTAQQLATHVGVDVLKSGGNAVDAAVAVGYALAVVYPAAGNLGGGGFMTIALADGRKTFLDFREQAPLAATADMYLDKSGNVIAGASTYGYLAVGVPGTVSGLEYARARYGTRPRAQLIAPAIRYARDGFVLAAGDVAMLHSATADFRKDAPSAAIFLNHGMPWQAGQKLVQRDLARTLQRISKSGAAGFYRGPVARAIVAGMQRGGGIITQRDLEQYRTRELKPVECSYRGYGVVSAPPPSSGGVTLCEMLNILEGYPLHDLGYRSAQAMQYQIEAMRHAYVDRNSYLGDPAFVHNPLDRLLSKDYAAEIRAVIQPHQAGISATLKPGVAPHEGSNTTHYSIIDRWGNAVAVTYTLNNWFGARVTAAHTGVLLNDEMDDFTSKVGVPNSFGLVQGAANAIAPGKRPLSSMTPTIVTKDGRPLLVLGTPGGSRIITVVLLTMLNVIDYGMDIQQAVDAPRFHQQWLPDYTNLELGAITPAVQATLEQWGQKFGPPQEANHVAAPLVGAPSLGGKPQGDNRYYGANDMRRSTGLALGY
jgi:gamma-glutamyltranspeptidase/glutathione hydrolase